MIDFIFNPELNKTLLLVNGIIIVFYIFFHILIRYAQSKKETIFSKHYLSTLGNYTINTNWKFLAVLFATQIIAFIIAFLVTDEITKGEYVKHIYMPSFFVAVIYIYIFCRKTGAKVNREAVMKSKSDVVVDFKYNALKKVFNVYLEIPFSLIILYFAAAHFNYSTVIIFFGLITWLNYFSLRSSKNMDKMMFKYTYLAIAGVNIFYQGLLMFVYIDKTLEFEGVLAWYDTGLYITLGGLLLVKTIIYLFNLPRLKKIVEFSSGEVNGSTINA